MKKLATLVFALLLTGGLTFAQSTSGSTSTTKAGKAHHMTKAHKGAKKGHKGGKKSKKGSTGATTAPPK